MVDLPLTPIGELEAHLNEVVNIAGIVLNYREPRKTKGDDFIFVLTMADDTCGNYQKFFTVNIFRKHLCEFPPIKSSGCVLVLRGIRICRYENALTGMSNNRFRYKLLEFNNLTKSLVSTANTFTVELASEVLDKAKGIYQNFRSIYFPEPSQLKNNQPAPPVQTSNRSKAKTLCELQLEDCKFNFYGEILHMYAGVGSQVVNVFLTDYTRNPLANASEREYPQVKGITQSMVINVKFWDENATIRRAAHVGDIIFCKWLHAKPMGPEIQTLTFALRNLYDAPAFQLITAEEIAGIPEVAAILDRKKELFFTKAKVMNDKHEAYHSENLSTTNEGAKRRNTDSTVHDSSLEHSEKKAKTDITNGTSVSDVPANYISLADAPLYKPCRFYGKFIITQIIPSTLESICSLFCSNCKIYHANLCTECFECGFVFDVLSYAYRFVVQIAELDRELNENHFMIVDYRAADGLMNGIVPTNLQQDRYTLELIKEHLEYVITEKVPISAMIANYKSIAGEGYRLLLCNPVQMETKPKHSNALIVTGN